MQGLRAVKISYDAKRLQGSCTLLLLEMTIDEVTNVYFFQGNEGSNQKAAQINCTLFVCLVQINVLASRKVEKFQDIKKRGAVPKSAIKKGSSYPMEPIAIGFFIFVVIGSSYLMRLDMSLKIRFH